MRTRSTLPAPEWRVMSSGGSADPVRMNWPGRPRSSQARRIGFQMSGASCHSSSSSGGGASSSAAGSTFAASRAWTEASISTSSAANRRPVHVLPQARGPSISTAGDARSDSRISASTTRGRYSLSADLPCAWPAVAAGRSSLIPLLWPLPYKWGLRVAICRQTYSHCRARSGLIEGGLHRLIVGLASG